MEVADENRTSRANAAKERIEELCKELDSDASIHHAIIETGFDALTAPKEYIDHLLENVLPSAKEAQTEQEQCIETLAHGLDALQIAKDKEQTLDMTATVDECKFNATGHQQLVAMLQAAYKATVAEADTLENEYFSLQEEIAVWKNRVEEKERLRELRAEQKRRQAEQEAVMRKIKEEEKERDKEEARIAKAEEEERKRKEAEEAERKRKKRKEKEEAERKKRQAQAEMEAAKRKKAAAEVVPVYRQHSSGSTSSNTTNNGNKYGGGGDNETPNKAPISILRSSRPPKTPYKRKAPSASSPLFTGTAVKRSASPVPSPRASTPRHSPAPSQQQFRTPLVSAPRASPAPSQQLRTPTASAPRASPAPSQQLRTPVFAAPRASPASSQQLRTPVTFAKPRNANDNISGSEMETPKQQQKQRIQIQQNGKKMYSPMDNKTMDTDDSFWDDD